MPNLVGIGLSQVPTNGMLGGMAYQDPEHASIKNLDLKNLSQIDAEIADTTTAVFVYDTRKDSDGGAWRKRTQNTSWYNETLGTEYRGTRKEFPAVAVIVGVLHGIKIYDGDDPDLPLWAYYKRLSWDRDVNSIAARDGKICFTIHTNNAYSGNGFGILDFVKDRQSRNYISGYSNFKNGFVNDLIASKRETNTYLTHGTNTREFTLIDYNAKDVAITVLPNAPIDIATGLPVPTIAVGTINGVSVIKDDGNVADITNSNSGYNYVTEIEIDEKYVYIGFGAGSSYVGGIGYAVPIPSGDVSLGSIVNATGNADFRWSLNSTSGSGVQSDYFINPSNLAADDVTGTVLTKRGMSFGTESGMSILLNEERDTNGSVAFVTTSYNTGYMPEDTKVALLSDTTTGSISTNEYAGGDFSSNITGWSGNSNSTLSNPSGVLRVLSNTNGTWNGANAMYQLGNTFVVGKTYSVTYDMRVGGTTGNYSSGIGSRIQKDTSFHSANTLQSYYLYAATAPGTSFTTYSWTFVAERTQYGLEFFNWYGVVNNYFEVDNIVVKEAVADRSIFSTTKLGGNQNTTNGLAVYGTITKSAVATGAELVAYSGFSGSNYLQQPYNTDFNFGSGSFSLSGWFKTNSTSGGGAYMYRGTADGDESFRIYLDSSNYGVYFDYGGGSAYSYLTNASDRTAIWNQEWNQLVCQATASGEVKIYVNGVSKDITVAGAPPSSFSSTNTHTLRFGTNYGGGVPFPGSLALFRVSGSIPSPEQIKKMYDDEKALFQENAKATLHGSSDAVTALAYDDTTNLLHVGTSAGRSEFQGLHRINNTTDAITTAISASNELVAEQ